MEPEGPLSSEEAARQATTTSIRGSTLLLVGRLLAVGVNFVTHVLIVRYLMKSDYGAWAYAASIVSIGSSVAVFGMNKTLARFVPIYDERGDYDHVFGALAIGLGIMVSMALSLVLLFYGLQGAVGGVLIGSDQALALLLILILLIPIQTLESALVGLFAIFASPRLIFMRRHVMTPLLQLGVAIAVIASGGDVFQLATITVLVGSFGLVLSSSLLVRLLRERGLFKHFSLARMRLPVREMLGFSLPLLSTDVVFMLRGSLIVVLLGAMSGATEVAAFHAVAPIAGQNMLVLDSFRLLFMPAAARLYARDDGQGIDDLYWRTAVWIAIFTLPILLVSLSLALPLTTFLFGADYADSALVLAILSVGYYVNAAFGFNGLTLRVYGRVRYLVAVDVLTAALGVVASVLLIQLYGAVGAALGVTVIFIAQNALYQIGLRRRTSVSAFATRYLRVYVGIVLSTSLLLLIQWTAHPPLIVGLLLAAAVSLVFLAANRSFLRIAEMFPELRRVPLLGALLD